MISNFESRVEWVGSKKFFFFGEWGGVTGKC